MKARDAASRDRGGADLAAYLDRLVPPDAEAAYERTAGYGFARRYVAGKRVADLCWNEMGHGTRLLSETAGSVAGMAVSAEAARVASEALSAPNVRYETLDPSGLPYPDGHFDVVVALGLIGHLDDPEGLVAEARRVLKEDGVLVVSFPDGYPADSSGPGELLEGHFGRVRLYRQGAVSGGVVSSASGAIGGVHLESVSLSPASPRPGGEPPATASVVAVCGGPGLEEGDGRTYVLLDRDRRIFEERDDLTEDVEMLRDEIENMQRTEVQAFRDSLKLRNSEISHLRAEIRRLRRSERRSETQILALRAQIRDIESSTTWRIFEPYRRLRARLDAARRSLPGGGKGNEDRR